MKEKMFECEHKPGKEVVLRFRPPKAIPSSTKIHLASAQKELLLALRSFIDAAIESMEEADKPKERTNIEIQ